MWIISIDEVFGGSIWFEYWYAQHIMLWKDFWVYNNQPSIVAPFLAEIAHSGWCCSFGQTNILGESADRWQHMLSKISVGVRRVYFLFSLSTKEGEWRWSQGGEGGGGEAGQRQKPSYNPPWEQSRLVMAMKYSLNDDMGECMDERRPERECKTSGARAWKAQTSRNSSFVGKLMKSW